MDAWLKSAVQQATTLGNEFQQLVERNTTAQGGRELEFGVGPLGFELDGVRVVTVHADSQAERLGVKVGDRLAAVEGFEIPLPKKWDEEADRRLKAQVKKWLQGLPRPGSLTFVSAEVDTAVAADGSAASRSAPTSEPSPSGSPRVPSKEASQASGGVGSAAAAPATNSSAEVADLLAQLDQVRSQLQTEKDHVSTLRTELYIAQEESRNTQLELEDFRRECQALRHMAAEHDDGVGTAQSKHEVQIRSLQEQLLRMREECDAARAKANELQSQLARAEQRCEELRLVGAHEEDVVREAFEGREQILEEEVARLRAALSAADAQANKAIASAAEKLEAAEVRSREELQAAAARRVSDLRGLEVKVTAAESSAAAATRELRAAREEHQETLAEERARQRRLEAQLEEACQEVKRKTMEAEAAAACAAAEGAEPGQAAAKAPKAKAWSPDSDSEDAEEGQQSGGLSGRPGGPPGEQVSEMQGASSAPPVAVDSLEVIDLRERVRQLENRCCSLQKKLNARPIVFKAPKGADVETGPSTTSGQSLSWEPWLRATLGPQAAGMVIRLYGAPDRALRSFTQRLLKRDAWLRAFYVHLVLLYAIAASWYAQTTSDAASPLDSLTAGGGIVQQHAVDPTAVGAGHG